MATSTIRAGRAFVEMFINDETVQASLENLKSKMKAFGTTVNAVGAQSFATMSTVASTSLATTTASTGVLAASLGVVEGVLLTIGATARAIFGFMSTSVLRAAGAIGVMSVLFKRMAKDIPQLNVIKRFLPQSDVTEAVGRWTRFFGLITGSRGLKQLGNQIERIGLGTAIVQGFERSGLRGGIWSALGAAVRSSKSIVASAIGSVFSAAVYPIKAVLSGAMSIGTLGASTTSLAATLSGSAVGANSLATALDRVSTRQSAVSSIALMLQRLPGVMTSLALKLGGVSALIAGPALAAARSFANAAEKSTDNPLLNKEDIAAGIELASAMKDVKKSISELWQLIGAAALPVLKKMTDNMRWLVDVTSSLLRNNRELMATVISVASQIGGASAATLVFVKAIGFLPVIMAALTSPLALVAGGIVAIAYLFPTLRQEALGVLEYLFGGFAKLGTIVQGTMTGIADAISGGNLTAAANVLWSAMQLAWLEGTANLRSVWNTMTTNMSSGFIESYAIISAGWAVVVSEFQDVWNIAIRAMANAWRTHFDNNVAGGFARLIAKFTGQDVSEVLKTLTEDQARAAKKADESSATTDTKRKDELRQRLADIEAARKGSQEANTEIGNENNQAARARLDEARKQFEKAKADAAKLRKPLTSVSSPRISGLTEVASLGSFGTSALGRQSIGGIDSLKKPIEETADATKEIAAWTKTNKGLAYS